MSVPVVLPLAFMGLGPAELVIVLIIVLVLFGGSRLPELGRGLGGAITNFKKANRDDAIDVTPGAADAPDQVAEGDAEGDGDRDPQ